jgi:hypothetical protein
VHVLKATQWTILDVDERVFGPDDDARVRNWHIAFVSLQARCALGHDAPAHFLRGRPGRQGRGFALLVG